MEGFFEDLTFRLKSNNEKACEQEFSCQMRTLEQAEKGEMYIMNLDTIQGMNQAGTNLIHSVENHYVKH